MRTFIVKSTEEELGEELVKVTFPSDVTKEEANKVFKMASAYANLKFVLDWENEANAEDYDEHFKEMCEVVDDIHGQGVFEYYLSQICGCRIQPLVPDFEYEW